MKQQKASSIINGYFDNVDNVNLCYVNNNISSFVENIAKEYIQTYSPQKQAGKFIELFNQ